MGAVMPENHDGCEHHGECASLPDLSRQERKRVERRKETALRRSEDPERDLDRRSFLRGTATAAAAGAALPAALSDTADAHDKWQPVYTYTELNIREGPSTAYDVIRTTSDYVGFRIEDGPYYNDGYRWWYFRVNGDDQNASKIRGYAADDWTNHPNFAYPTWGQVTSTYWDCRDDCNRYHRAIDIANDKGTNIYAAREGTVTYAGWVSGYGNVVYIDHGSGYETRYAHLNDIDTYDGAYVGDGEHIGDMGTTGNSTGDHLHFEIRRDGSKLNWPMYKYAYLWLFSAIPKNFSGISGAVYP